MASQIDPSCGQFGADCISRSDIAPAHMRSSPGALSAALRQGALLVARRLGRGKAATIIGASGLFDAAWYLAEAPDAAASGDDPLAHYLAYGAFEGRSTHPLFHAGWYLARNPDVARAGVDPLLHFLKHGAAEGRDPHPLFRAEVYRKALPNDRAAQANPLRHFLDTGGRAGVDPHPLFKTAWYLERYPDVAAADTNALVDYLTRGAAAGRDPNLLFRSAWYLARHPDVVGNPLVDYVMAGEAAGRWPNHLFDPLWVRARTGAHEPLADFLRREPYAFPFTAPNFDLCWFVHRCRLLGDAGSGAHTLAAALDHGPIAPADRMRPTHSTWRRVSDGMTKTILSLGPFDPVSHDHDAGVEAAFLHRIATAYHRDRSRFDAIGVSVVMPTYQRAHLVGTAIRSVLTQTHGNWELIVVDDGSTDGTAEVIASFDDPRIRYVARSNGGCPAARNTALAQARHDLIAYLDDDNEWLPHHLRTMVVFIDLNGLDLAYAGMTAVNDIGLTAYTTFPRLDWLRSYLIGVVDTNTIAHRRAIVDEVGQFDALIEAGDDRDLINRVMFQTDRVALAPSINATYHGRTSLDRMQNEFKVNPDMRARVNRRVQDKFELVARHPAPARSTAPARSALRYWPDWPDVRYLPLLYSAFTDVEVRAASIKDALDLVRDGRDVVFHLHWQQPVRDDRDPATFAASTRRFLGALETFRDAGGRVVWTLHESLPPESRLPALDAAFCQQIIDIADVVHVHDPKAVDDVAPLYRVPLAKCCVAPHGSYVGVYPDWIDRTAARRRLGLAEDAIVFLFLGLIRPYKGVEDLLAAFARFAPENPQARLVIAGMLIGDGVPPTSPDPTRVHLHLGHVPDEDMQVFLRAADAMVLPYRCTLTSSAFVLAQSYSLPTIAPRTAMFDAPAAVGTGLFYDARDANAVLDAMRQFSAMPADARRAMGARAFEAALACDWDATSRLLKARLFDTRGAA